MKFSLIRADDQVHLDVETFNLEPPGGQQATSCAR